MSAVGARSAPLVSTRDKSGDSRCPTPVVGMRFKLANGRFVPVPCGRSTCPACSRRSAMVTAAMVGLDAQEEQPWVVSTFTTRDPVTPAQLRYATADILKLVRAELGPVRCCSFLEFTTGKARRSEGIRRPHLHTLWKDVNPADGPVIAGSAGYVLESRAGAWRHDVEEIRSPAGATMYLARHHLKESQAPPKEWGPTRRVRPSRGYWSRPAAELRTEAVALVRTKRIESLMWGRWLDRVADGEVIPEEVWEDFVVEPALKQAPPEVLKVREVAGRMIEVIGPVR